jgi:MFS family permease
MNISWGLGAAVGAPLGGWLGDTIGWRAAFSCQAPILACGLLLVSLKVQEPPFILNAQRTTLLSKLKRIDYAGTFGLVAALLTFVVGMNFKTILGQEWDDPKVWGYLLTSYFFLSSGISHLKGNDPELFYSAHSLLSSSSLPQSPSWPPGCSSRYVCHS